MHTLHVLRGSFSLRRQWFTATCETPTYVYIIYKRWGLFYLSKTVQWPRTVHTYIPRDRVSYNKTAILLTSVTHGWRHPSSISWMHVCRVVDEQNFVHEHYTPEAFSSRRKSVVSSGSCSPENATPFRKRHPTRESSAHITVASPAACAVCISSMYSREHRNWRNFGKLSC